MIETFVLLLLQIWEHRRNRFIAVGGLAIVSILIAFAAVRIPGVPASVSTFAVAVSASFVVVMIILMIYYPLKFVGMAAVSLYRRGRSRSSAEKKNLN
jgi:hypothetical protein